jgi:UDP-glucose 4-epimerase
MILITGGAGYVGSHFVRVYALENPENRAVVLDNLCRGHRDAVYQDERIKFVRADLGDRQAISEILTTYPIDSVVHFAASAYVGESQIDPFKYLRNNVVESLTFFEVLEAHGVRKLVFSSTCATYGDPEYSPMDEKHPQHPKNVYGMTKLMTEQALRSLADTAGWASVSLRYFNAAGASPDGQFGESHEPETHLIPNILKVAVGREKSLTINGNDYETPDGTCVRDYVHVDDLADAHLKALSLLKNESKAQALACNLGTANGASILEVLANCEEVTKRSIAYSFAPRRSGDPAKLVANARLAESLLGWRPAYDLKQIIETAWNWEQHRRY